MTTVESLTSPSVATRPSHELDDATIRAFLRGALEPAALGEPAWGPIGREVFERTYSRDLGGRKETWAETCRRVVNGSLSYIDRSLWLVDEDVELFRVLFGFSALPAGRHLWVTGTELSYMSKNCFSAGFSGTPSDHFRFLASRLFEGGGVGSNYSADLMANLPPVVGAIALSVWCRHNHPDIENVTQAAGGALSMWGAADAETTIVVADTREGWVDAWAEIIDIAHTPGIHKVLVDVSSVRRYGAPLKTFGGQASGPGPLVSATKGIVRILNGAFHVGLGSDGPRRIAGLEAMAIDHEIASAVVAGGTRRCLPGPTRVNTTRGSVRIDHIRVGDEVVTVSGNAKVSAVFQQGRQELVLVTHAMGELRCTANHRIAVYDSTGSWSFKEAGELTTEDHLVWDHTGTALGINGAPEVIHPLAGRVAADTGVDPTTRQRFPGVKCSVGKCPSAGVTVLTPVPLCNTHYLRTRKWGDPLLKTNHGVVGFDTPELSPDFAWMIGLLHGNGNVSLREGEAPKSVRFAVCDDYPQTLDRLVAILSSFGRPTVQQHGPHCKQVTLANARFADWCFHNVKQAKRPLVVPEWIFVADAEVRWSYIAGLFDADGSCRTRPLLLATTVYETIAVDLVRLAASLGVAANVARRPRPEGKWQTLWDVSVRGQQNYEKTALYLNKYATKFVDSPRSSTGNGGNFGFAKEFAASHGVTSYGGTKNQIVPVVELERQGVDLGGAYPSRVVSVTSLPDPEDTFDIEVQDIHQFTADGLVVHNSARMAMMNWRDEQIFDFIACKQDQSYHWSTNISVEVDGAFAEAVAAGDPHATRVLREVAEGMALNGEPGLVDTGAHSADEPTPVRITNPCIVGDTWVQTSAGLRQVAELVGTGPVELLVHDVRWSTTDAGFFKTGTKDVLLVDIDGAPLKMTADHLVSTPTGWRPAGELRPGDAVVLTDSFSCSWSGAETAPDALSGAGLPGVSDSQGRIPDAVMRSSSEQVVDFVRRLFDARATMTDQAVSLAHESRKVLGQLRILLLALGVRGVVVEQALVISGADVERFAKVVGFTNPEKAGQCEGVLARVGPIERPEPMTGTVVSVAPAGVEDVYDCQVPCINSFVANGTIVHNCGEIGLQFDPEDAAGESCNIGSVDLAHFATDDAGAEKAFRIIARFLYRSTLNPHVDERVRRIELHNRRIGVGIMGLQGWCAAHGVRLSELADSPELHDKLEAFRRAARQAADDLAGSLRTPRSVKVTAVAPTGTIAQLSGTTPGIHPVMARYFVRRVRYADGDAQLPGLRSAGYTVVPDIYAANTSVVEFVVRDGILDRYPAELVEQADELSAAQFFDLIATVQRHFCGVGDGNAISATAQIAPDTDPDELIAAMRRHLGFLKGLTVFPKVSRELAPYEPLTEVEFLERTAELGVAMVGDSNDGECAGGACPIR